MQIDYRCLLGQDHVWHEVHETMRARGLQGGIYRVHALMPSAPPLWTADHMKPVPRAAGQDTTAILYIGMASAFTKRFIDLLKTLRPDYDTDIHKPALAYSKSPALKAAFPHLGFTLRFAENPRSAEREELEGYRSAYGELPPLNAQS